LVSYGSGQGREADCRQHSIEPSVSKALKFIELLLLLLLLLLSSSSSSLLLLLSLLLLFRFLLLQAFSPRYFS